MRSSLFLAVVVLVFTSYGCARAASQDPSMTAAANRSFISEAEIQASAAATAHDLVQRLRPHWLRAAGAGNIGGGAKMKVTLVYVDGVNMGSISSLRTISATGIKSMRWLDASRTAATFPDAGRFALNGAIVIATQ